MKLAAMPIMQQLKQAARLLPLREVEILLAFCLKKSRTYLQAYGTATLTAAQQHQFSGLITRRLRGEPIAYLLNSKEFWSLPLYVDQSVLIPRPETELLVELILQRFSNQADFYVADLGTGSGAIALALSQERPQWCITAVDFSTTAIDTARRNAKQLKAANITFLQSDWGALLPVNTFQLLVSNPPYLAATDPHLRQGDLRFEPPCALIAAQNGLAAFEAISAQAKRKLVANGYLFFEHGCDQKLAVCAILAKYGFIGVETFRDLSGRERVSCGYLT